jgi:hypothetical protein
MSRVYGERAERWGIEMSQEKAPPTGAQTGFPFGESEGSKEKPPNEE